MEIVGEDGTIFKVQGEGFKAEFGRGSGFNTKDRTVSRRHVLFQLKETEPRVSFQVVGKNPLWLRSGDGKKKLRYFRNLEKGEMEAGDCFCISSQTPFWFSLKTIESENWGNVEISQIDPVKEFGFLVLGHEFDCYPNGRIRNPENWDWFLEETRHEDDDSEDEKKRKRSGKRKRKKDEEWSDESEDMETAVEVKKIGRMKYITRSKDKSKPVKGERKTNSSKMKIEEEEDDDTLGGFIVNDKDYEEEGEIGDEEEEEIMEDEEDEVDD